MLSWMLAVPLVPPVPPVPLVTSFVLLDVPLVTLVLLDVPFWRHSGSFAAIGRTAKMRSMVVVCLVFNLAAGAQHPASEKGPTVAAGEYLALFRSVLLNLHYNPHDASNRWCYLATGVIGTFNGRTAPA